MPQHTIDLPLPTWVTLSFDNDRNHEYIVATLPCGCHGVLTFGPRVRFRIRSQYAWNCDAHKYLPPRQFNSPCSVPLYLERRKPDFLPEYGALRPVSDDNDESADDDHEGY